jgi:hypothetical protein
MSASVYKSNPLGRKTAYSSCSSKQFGGRITADWQRINIWIQRSAGLCAWIVPRNVASGDLSDSVDFRISNLRISNTG